MRHPHFVRSRSYPGAPKLLALPGQKRGLVEVLDTGLMAITVHGVDELGPGGLSLPANRLLTERSGKGRTDNSTPDIEPAALAERVNGM